MDNELADIMKMQVEETTSSLESSSEDGFFCADEIHFPLVADMKQAVLLLVESVKSFTVEGNTVKFQCNGRFWKKRYFYRFFDFRPAFDKMPRTRNICVSLTFCSENIVRLRAEQGFSLTERKNSMVVNDFKHPVSFKIQENNDLLNIDTSKIRVCVNKKEWNLSITDSDGKVLFSQFGEEFRSFMKFESCPFGFLYDTERRRVYACETAYIRDTEHFYGFGEKFSKIDKKGQNINLWNTNGLGVYSTRTYKNIPFFISTEGYGLFMNTSRKTNCNMGAQSYKAYSLMTEDTVIDNYIICDSSIKNIIKGYAEITGRPAMPPLWSFGFWISKISYETQDEVLRLAERFRKEKIPCDVIHIDTNWYEENWVCDFKFAPRKFPDPAGMIQKLAEQGFKITLWQMPYIDRGKINSAVYNEGFEKGYFAFAPDGLADFRHGLIDFSNPEAVIWYKEKLLRPLLEMGVAAIKVDFGESAPDFYQYAGCSGQDMHNLYALLYNQACFEITEAVHGKGQAVIWARSAWAGSQRYPLHWGGDSGTDFTALVTSIKAGLGFGLCGFPFWSHDTGGFFFATNPELYVRWMQVGVFTSHMRAHGFYTREPWDFGDEAKKITADYLRLRYALLPYIYSQAKICCDNCLPLMRALVLEYQDDENVHDMDNEYLFGDAFLVAPIVEISNKRKVYLPAGDWFDYWNDEVIQGGIWIDVDVPLERIPLYVKNGTIIPLCKPMQYTTEKEWDVVELHVYFASDGEIVFPLFDGKETDFIRITVTDDTITILTEVGRRTYEPVLHGKKISRILLNTTDEKS